MLDPYLRRAGMDKEFSKDALILPGMNGKSRGIALDLALIAMLWDYANPFGVRLSTFGPAVEVRK